MYIIKARAKINLFFHITRKSPDGYHLMQSLNVFADDIYDLIEINPASENGTTTKSGEFAYLLSNERNNLITKALEEFTSKLKYHCLLTKNIPIGAGLGGGSADAAMVAKFLVNQLSLQELQSFENIQNINERLLKIGADLPLCYYDAPSFCSGIGEIIESVYNFPKLHLLLVNPKMTLLTKDVFKNNSKIETSVIEDKILDFNNDLERLIQFLKPLTNDLSEAAIKLMPEIQFILTALKEQHDSRVVSMSGSGPTCFAIFSNQQSALQAEKNIANLFPDYWVKYTGS